MRKLVSVVFLALVSMSLGAQEKDPVLLTVGGNEVKLSEFNAIFNKNKSDDKITDQAIQDYLELYINFKLKVREAEALGYDTLPKFTNELKGYRKQLAQPYLTDKEVTEALIKEAYQRMKQDVRASHILIRLDEDAPVADTLAAYQKIMNIRKRALKEDFDKLTSELTSPLNIKKLTQELEYWTDNKNPIIDGQDLGYFSALHMVYPFETAAYTNKVGDVSKPVRTKFGYHIIKVTDKRPARGTMRAAHIMIKAGKTPNDTVQKKKIDEIYEKLKGGEDFAKLAEQYSDDKGSARRGGELPEFNAGKMVAEFESAAFAIENDGDYSKPFQTKYGWHIVKRLNLKELDSYEVLYNTLKARVSRDSRSNKSMKSLIDKIKKTNNFKENLKERNDFYKLYTAEDYKKGGWDAAKAKKYNQEMFSFSADDGDKVAYTQGEFATLLSKQRSKYPNKEVNMESIINQLYDQEVERVAVEFKDNRLPKTNDEFRLLMQEYRDGILLFDLTDEKVWSKAVRDSAGLLAFYERNKQNYMWSKRVKATLYKCSNQAVADKVMKLVKKKQKKGYTNKQILEMVNTDSQLSLQVEEDSYSKDDNKAVDQTSWEAGIIEAVKTENGVTIVQIEEVLEPQPKGLDEIRGLITSDYQTYLEEEWVKELKGKYKVEVNKEVLKLVK